MECQYLAIKHVGSSVLFNLSGKESRSAKTLIFSNFIEKHLKLTKTYDTLKQIEDNPPESDVYIAGSDQIWNMKITDDGIDDAYYLQFGPRNVKRVVYAASIGITPVNVCSKHIKGLEFPIEHISFREENVAKEFSLLSGKECSAVPDPTLLLSANDYNEIIEKTLEIETPYILVYILQKSEILNDTIKSLASCFKYKIVEISPTKKYSDSEFHENVSPSEFLAYFKNAEMVITNSFHGTVFSLIYNKEVFCGTNYKALDSRISSLLENVGLSQRLITKFENLAELKDERIDYQVVNEKLKMIRKSGLEYLNNSLLKSN
jgi:hypothetical protein